jgi:hypothetical protein
MGREHVRFFEPHILSTVLWGPTRQAENVMFKEPPILSAVLWDTVHDRQYMRGREREVLRASHSVSCLPGNILNIARYK